MPVQPTARDIDSCIKVFSMLPCRGRHWQGYRRVVCRHCEPHGGDAAANLVAIKAKEKDCLSRG